MTKKKLHILFLNSWYPSTVLPNNGDFIQRHAEAVSTKHEVTAIHVISDKSIKKETIKDFHLNGVRTIIAYIKPAKFNFIKQIRFLNTYLKLVSMSDKFDMVHVNRLYPVGLIAIWIKIFRSKPYIISEHYTGYLKSISSNLSKKELMFSKIITKYANFVCPVSKNLAENMYNLGLHGNYHPVSNVVDTEVFTPSKTIKKHLTLIHLSSLNNEQKNIKEMLGVISTLQSYIHDFIFYLIGPNPSKYQSLIKSLDIDSEKIKLIDQIPHQFVASYLQKSDVLILFSNFENLPCVILEAFACGTKVISTDVGGISEFFPRNFGKLVPVKDKNEFLNSILQLQKNKKLDHKNEMHIYAENNFGIEKISTEFSELYFKSLNKKNA